MNPEVIQEAKNEGETADGGKDLVVTQCGQCTQLLSEDEVTINQRFVDQALTSAETPTQADASNYPLCVKCLFE